MRLTMAAQEIFTNPQNQNQNLPPGGESVATAAPPPPPKKNSGKILKVLGLVLGFLVLIFLVIRFVLPLFSKKGGNTIVWWGLWEDEKVVSELISQYESENPNVKIEYIKQSKEDYRERLTNALAKGEGPDIFRFHNTWVPMFKEELSILPVETISPAEYARTFYPVMTNDLTGGEGFVGIPLGFEALTLFINEDIFNEAGKTPPATWDDLRQVAKELTIKDEREVIQRAGIALGRTENVDHWQEILTLMLLQNGANPASPADNLTEDALTFFTVFSKVDGVWDETMPPSTIAFAAGKLAMYFGPSWRAFEIANQSPNLKFRTVELPQLPESEKISYATYWAEGVWERSSKKEEAWKFLRFMMRQDSLEKFFKTASSLRGFGEAYPRVDMASLLADHSILGSIISLAPNARSWYLASRTFDGPTGINTQLSSYFEDAINAINDRTDVKKTLEPLSLGVEQVLTQYAVR